MRPDNTQPDNAEVVLKGSIFRDSSRVLGASKFFELNSPLQFVLGALNCGKFRFNNTLVSEPVDSAHFPFWFRVNRDSEALSLEEVTEKGFKGFTLRAYLAPSSITNHTWMRLTILLFPAPLTSFLDNNPHASSPYFPGITIFSDLIALGPRTKDLFPDKKIGSPIVPGIISSEPFTENTAHPTTASLAACISAVLRSAYTPNAHMTANSLLAKWTTIRTDGESALTITPLAVIWPEADNPVEPPEGWFFFFLLLVSNFSINLTKLLLIKCLNCISTVLQKVSFTEVVFKTNKS